jgi:hypothetical protein
MKFASFFVTPAQAGVQSSRGYLPEFILGPRGADPWAGMTERGASLPVQDIRSNLDPTMLFHRKLH